VEKSLRFPVLLRLIDERSEAFRTALLSAPALDLKVPGCPEWTLLDLAQHLGAVHRRWAAVVTAGPADAPPAELLSEDVAGAPREREALLAWSAESTQLLLDALRAAGPDRGCWTWWGESDSPQTSAAVARHQVQEAAVHAYDAQLTAGSPEPLPDEVAVDGVEEFLVTCAGSTGAWPHEPTAADFHATEGRSWRLSLSADGGRTTRLSSPTAVGEGPEPAAASARGTASDLVLALYERITIDSLQLDGDRRLFDQLSAW
jgi:uncharacterized protein (TIGR03083 family)